LQLFLFSVSFSNLQTANDLQLMQSLMNNSQKIQSPSGKITPTSQIENSTTGNNEMNVNSTTASLLSLISQSGSGIKMEK
jgi:hypothetical protein